LKERHIRELKRKFPDKPELWELDEDTESEDEQVPYPIDWLWLRFVRQSGYREAELNAMPIIERARLWHVWLVEWRFGLHPHRPVGF